MSMIVSRILTRHFTRATQSAVTIHRAKRFTSFSLNHRLLLSQVQTGKRPRDGSLGTHCRCFSSSATAASDEIEEEGSIESQYLRKTPLEHVLLRPGMYVGPNERLPPQTFWVLDPPFPAHQEHSSSSSAQETVSFRLVKKDIPIVPALVKVFDEILVNASDNRLRHPKSCSRIDVTITPGSDNEDPLISIYNDGKGIPIQIHKQENMYLPEMLFGHLLTGSNFNDDEKRITGGRHGYGAKLTNIFAKKFTVETADAKRGLCYSQTWFDNMTRASEPVITELSSGGGADYTRISFVPDLPRLTGDSKAKSIAAEDYSLMCRRVVDVAGCAAEKLTVTLNGRDVSMPSFAHFVELHRKSSSPPLIHHSMNSRWKVSVGLSDSGSFESVSFVNGMATHRGGTHVNALVQQISKKIQEKIEKLDPNLAKLISHGLVRRHLFVACDALIENPTFDSQMKEYLTSSPTNFGSSYALTQKLLNDIVKPEDQGGPGIVEDVLRVASGRQQANLIKELTSKKSRRQLLSIPKLEEAHQAGSDSGWDCTLILTEGDSAKAIAVAGLEVIGRERFGVFPLRGKFLNVRDASVAQLTNNAEVKALCSILGLDFDRRYETLEERRELRYGRVMLMTDQDQDGSHIKGLVINFFRYFWPCLLRSPVDQSLEEAEENPPFLSAFVTPLLKASRKGAKGELAFYSMAEYNAWRDTIDPSDLKKYRIKYYKGLGTSTTEEAKGYFAAFDDHIRPFKWRTDADGDLLDMVFDKNRAAHRREWILETYDETSSLEINPEDGNAVGYDDFINKELVHFSHADNIRSIPSAIDGLKPSQRKVLYACFKRHLNAEMKVAQLAGYCAEQTAYHHGEASLQSTIIGMAQDFVGSNNINLLVPSGQFGTRMTGGADAASPRYIFTYLSPIARLIFPEADDMLLRYREDDGQKVEPEYFVPIIPLLAVNGGQGIGTGWSTFIPSHNPVDTVDYIRYKLDKSELRGDSEVPRIRPYARGFFGKISETPTGFVTTGKVRPISKNSVVIEELPLRCWTSTYKEQLIKMRNQGDIAGFVENHTTSKVSVTVDLQAAKLTRFISSGLESAFKLETKLPTTNMNAFDVHGTITKFDSAESIANDFFPVRMSLYEDRKSVLESELRYDAEMLSNKARFIEAVATSQLDLASGRKGKGELVADIKSLGFLSDSDLLAIRSDNCVMERHSSLVSDEQPATELNDGYGYLLNMPLSSLTSERILALRQDAAKRGDELKRLIDTKPADLWRSDLDRLASHLNK